MNKPSRHALFLRIPHQAAWPLLLLTACLAWCLPAHAEEEGFTRGGAPERFSSPDDPIYPDIYTQFAPRSAADAEGMMRALQQLKRSIERKGLGGTDLSFLGTGTDYTMPPSIVVTTKAETDTRKVRTIVDLPVWPRKDGDTWKAEILVSTDLDMYREELWELELAKEGGDWGIKKGTILKQTWKKYRHGAVRWARNVASKDFTISNDRLKLNLKEGTEVYLGYITGDEGRSFLIFVDGNVEAELRPPNLVERRQMERYFGEDTFKTRMKHAALHFHHDDLFELFQTWPLEDSPDLKAELKVNDLWYRYFRNAEEAPGEFAERYSPLFEDRGDFLCVMEERGSTEYFFYRRFANDPEWSEEIIFGTWDNPAILGVGIQGQQFQDAFGADSDLAMVIAMNTSMMRETDDFKREMFSDFGRQLSTSVGQSFGTPEYANFFTQVASGRPHWGEEQVFARWRQPEITDRAIWTVWCQYESPEDRDIMAKMGSRDGLSSLSRQDKTPVDVTHIKVAVTVDPRGGQLHMDSRVDLIARQDIERVPLLLNEEVSVQSIVDEAGRHIFHEHTRGRLLLKLAEPLKAGERKSFFFYIYTEPEELFAGSGRLTVVNWQPDMGYLSPKTTDMLIQVPKRMEALGSGSLVSKYSDGKHNFFHFRTDKPALGPSFAYGRYTERAIINTDVKTVPGVAPDGVKVASFTTDMPKRIILDPPDFFLDASLEGSVFNNDMTSAFGNLEGQIQDISYTQTFRRFRENTPVLLDAFSEIMGPYPYSHFSIVEPEFQSYSGFGYPGMVLVDPAVTIPDGALNALSTTAGVDPTYNNTFLAHEIARQWWGFLVTHPSYHDRWISTGLCQITAGWVIQSAYGDAQYKNMVQRWEGGAKAASSQAPLWLGYRRVSMNESFHLLYHKAGMVMHMLRSMLPRGRDGEETAFLEILKKLDERGRTQMTTSRGITTTELQFLVEEALGEEVMERAYKRPNLNWFFDQWVYGIGYPQLDFETNISQAQGQWVVQVNVTQTQKERLFVLPSIFTIKLRGGKKAYRRVIIDDQKEEFTFLVDERVRRVSFDENHFLIADVKGIDR